MSKAETSKLSPDQKRQMLAKLLQQQVTQPQRYPLAFAQKRLWFLDQLQPDLSVYNLPAVLRLTGKLGISALEQSLQAIINRHEVLRTSFEAINGEAVQNAIAKIEFALPVVDLRGLSIASQKTQVTEQAKVLGLRPFVLNQAPLWRAILLQLGDEEYVLLFVMHHIIADYWSLRVLVRELGLFYQAYSQQQPCPLPELSIQYGDFAIWQQKWLQSEARNTQLLYWLQQLQDYPRELSLPTDYPRTNVQSFQGAREHFTLATELSSKLKQLGQQQGATLFMTLLAGLNVLLYRYSGQEDILVGSTVTSRDRKEITDLIGFFVNNLVFRTKISGNLSFGDLLQQVRDTSIAALAHQELPFEDLVEQLQPERDLSKNPLFQVMFVLHNTPNQSTQIPGLIIEPIATEHSTTRFDLSLDMYETPSGLTGMFEYSTDLFQAATIKRMIEHFQRLLLAIVENPQQGICELALLTDAEQQLFREWNDTAAEIPDLCVHELFSQQAARTPDKIAVIFEDQSLTYQELNNRVNQLACYLQQLGIEPETRVGIFCDRSLDMVTALLAVLKVGGAYIPLDPAYPQERITYILADAQVSILLTQAKLRDSLPDNSAKIICVDTIYIDGIDRVSTKVCLEQLAYIIYTSGSTGKPKGVQILHKGLTNFLISMAQTPGLAAEDKLLAVTTLAFDIAALEIFLPLIVGASLVLVSREVTLDGQQLADAIAQYQITVMQATPATWRLLFANGWNGKADLKILCGGEALDNSLAQQLLAQNQEVWNLYGPTETTIWSAVKKLELNQSVTIGHPIANTQFYVLNQHLQPVAVGVPGELYIGGAGVARGYWGKPDLTAARFIPNVETRLIASLRHVYQTGDRVRYLPNGDLEYLGRLDNQVKIRGFRIELGEIESVVQTHPAVFQAVAIVWEQERLLAYVVLNYTYLNVAAELRAFLSEKLPAYMIPRAFVVLEELPLTPNGKINRKALPAPDNSGLSKVTVSKSQTEELLAAIWVSVLGVDTVGFEDNFFDLGGHSLLATRVVAQIRQVFGVELPLRQLFETRKLADLARVVEQMVQGRSQITIPRILPIERTGELPLSFAQERFWILTQIEPESPFYNIPLAVRIVGNLDVGILEQSFQEVIQQQEILRTRFESVDGEPLLRIADDWQLRIPVIDLQGLSAGEQQRQVEEITRFQALQPFDLAENPALRVQLLRLGDRDYIVLLTLHHIIADAWSIGLFVREVAALYGEFRGMSHAFAERLSATRCANVEKAQRRKEDAKVPRIQYVDFAHWQRKCLQGEVLGKHLDYWLRHLADAPALLELPTDYPRPAVQSFQGGVYRFQLSAELTQALKQLSQRHHSTLFMTMLAAWNVLLHRYTGSDRIVVGSPIANRQQAETEALIGCFANTLAFCTDFSEDPSFAELLQKVRHNALSAYTHQDLPFEQLVEAIQPVRSLSYTPIFQVMLILQNLPVTELEMSELKWQIIDSDSGTSKYDLTWTITETQELLDCKLEYSTDLFKLATIERLVENLQILLESITKNPQQKISKLPILSINEQQLLTQWNQTQREYPDTEYLHKLFELQVEQNPQATAAIWGKESISYQELNTKANQLAHYLQRLGVKPEVTVGICVNRSLDMLIGLLAILKAGGAYVPLDANYPQERLKLIIQDAQIQVAIIQQQQLEKLPNLTIPVVNLDVDAPRISQENTANPHINLTATNLAYLIYTSGTTGIPKGVAISHHSPITLMYWAKEIYSSSQLKGVLASTSICFDLSVFEIFVPLSWGGTVILADNALQLPELPAKSQVTLLNTVPSAARELMRLGGIPASVQTVNLAGEPLPQSLVEELYQQPSIEQVINLYGPSEDTTYSTIAIIPKHNQQAPTIGQAIANTQVYILDQNLQPVPIGVPGEIYLGGAGMARGYWQKPDLTAEKFVPNPNQQNRIYKTGDRARFLEDGNIEYLGRWDYQVKLRGFRIELGEIETILSQHPAVLQAVAMVRQDMLERLVAYIVTKSTVQERELREFITTKLPSYMVPSIFVFLESLPLTTNGKIDRRNLPIPELPVNSFSVTPRTPLEHQLTQIWSQVLGVELVGIHDNFFSLGGDSILAIQVVAKANQQGLAVFPRQIFQYQTVAELAAIVETNGEISLSQEVVTGEVPLTPIQQWFFEENLVEPHHWNQAVFLEVQQPLNFSWLQQAWEELVSHHDVLRSRFVQTPDGWVQQIESDVQPNITHVDMSELGTSTPDAITNFANQLQASFDLGKPPLLRVAYMNLGDGKNHRLLIILHHLIVDGVSWRILLEDLRSLYQQLSQGLEIKLPPKTTSFQQWAIKLREYTRFQNWQSTLDYWIDLPWQQVQPLPVDFPHGSNTIADVNSYSVSLSYEDTQALLQQVPSTYNTQINDILLTALMLAFHNWTGNSTLSLELEGHGREDLFPSVNLSRTVGWFTSLFPVCLYMGASDKLDVALKTIKEQLRQVPERGIGYGLIRYLASSQIQTQLRQIPSPQIRFNYLGQSDQVFSSDLSLFTPAREFTGYSRSLGGTRSNLIEINSIVTGGKLRFDWLYSRQIHQPQTITKLADNYFTKLLELIQHCLSSDVVGFTPSDFPQMEFTQDELDDLLADL